MIPGHPDRGFQTAKQGAVCFCVYFGCFSVHQFLGVGDNASEGLADCLMAETYAEDGRLSCEMTDHFKNIPGVLRAGPALAR